MTHVKVDSSIDVRLKRKYLIGVWVKTKLQKRSFNKNFWINNNITSLTLKLHTKNQDLMKPKQRQMTHAQSTFSSYLT